MLQQDKMTDTQAPRLNSLYFYLSSYCNLNCAHCWIAPNYINADEAPQETSLSLLQEIIDQALALGLRHIKISGGEPFLNKNIFSLISYACRKQLTIDIETNATLLNDDTARFLKENTVRFIAVSLDGHTSQIHEALRRKDGCFNRAVEGIRFLKKYGFNTQVILSAYKGNVDAIEDTLKLAEGLGVNSFKINCITNIARGATFRKNEMALSVTEYLALNKKINLEIQPRHKIRIILDIPPAFKAIQALKSSGICGVKGILGILSDGRVSICGIGNVLSSLVLGDIRRDSLKDIWMHNPLLVSIREGLPGKLKGVCATCILKAFCLGRCRAEAYYTTGDLFSGFSFCEEAFRLGLFPAERTFIRKEEVAV